MLTPYGYAPLHRMTHSVRLRWPLTPQKRELAHDCLDSPSAVMLLSAVVIAFTLIPTRMREVQAEFDETGFEPTGDDAPGLVPLPQGAVAPLGEPMPQLAPIRVRGEGV
jgi:hypothetical protein